MGQIDKVNKAHQKQLQPMTFDEAGNPSACRTKQSVSKLPISRK